MAEERLWECPLDLEEVFSEDIPAYEQSAGIVFRKGSLLKKMLQHFFSVAPGSKPLFHRQFEKWKTNNEEIGMTKMEVGNEGIKILRV